jgi:hypothetical protein
MKTARAPGVIALAALLLMSASAASAEETTPDKDMLVAKEAFEAAQTAFVKEQYDVAAEKFLSAFEHKPYPAFLFNAAVSLEKAKQLDRAKEYFEKYLQTDPNATDAAQVKVRIEELTKLLTPPPPPPPMPEPAAPGAPPTTAPTPTPTPPTPVTPAQPLPAFDTKGLVIIDSKPQGATIYLNDKRGGPFGKTPWHGSLEPKPVRLILESKGFKSEQRNISPRSDKMVDVYIALSQEHYLGWIEVTSTAPGAEVFIDRKDIGAIGRTPFTGHLKPGKHTIYLERLGWKPAETVIEVQPGTATQHTVTMERTQSGFVTVGGRGAYGGRLLVDDKFACLTPCRSEVAPGKHEVTVEKQGMEDYAGDVNVAQTTETTLDVRFNPRLPRTRVIPTAVVAAVLIAGGAIVGTLSDNVRSSIDADIKAGKLVDNQDPRFMRGKLEAIGADVFYGLGALVGASVVWNLVFSHGPESTAAVEQRTLGFAPTAAPGGGAGLAAWGHF